MFENVTKSREIVKAILRERNYFIAFLMASIFIFAIFYVLTLATVTNQSMGIFIMMNGLAYTVSTFILFAVISLLFGIYVSLLSFSIKTRLKRRVSKSILGTGGLIAGIFGAGCPMCGSAIFALFGMPLALFLLPFKGLELRALSLLLLGLSVYLLSISLVNCKIKTKVIKIVGG